MMRERRGSSVWKAATVLGAASSSRRARNVNAPAVIFSMPLSLDGFHGS